MSFIEIFALSAALGADLFSLAVPIGMTRVDWTRTVKASLVFALFHIGMILAGYYIGHWLGNAVEQLGEHYVNIQAVTVENFAKITGATVLALLGFYMFWENISQGEGATDKRWLSVGSPLEGTALIMLAVSVSIDALAAGFSLGMIEVDLLKISAILGSVIFIISVIGLNLGRQIGRHIGAKAGLVGGVVLILLGANVLWTIV